MSDTTDQEEFEAAFRDASSQLPGDASHQPGSVSDTAAADELLPDPGATRPLTDPATVSTDIWSNATDEQRAAFTAAQDEARRLTHRVASDEGRVARYQRERDEAKRAVGAVTGVAKQEDLSAYMASEEWTKTKAEYGDDLKPLFLTMERLAERNKVVEGRFSELDAEQAEKHELSQQAILTDRAPDWRDLLGSEQFSPWLETQPQHVQEAFGRNFQQLTDIDQAVDVVERFRASGRATPSQQTPLSQQLDHKRAVQLDASRSVRSKVPAVAESADDFEGFWKQAAAQKERQRVAQR